MEHTQLSTNTEITADGIIGFSLSAITHFAPQLFCAIVYAVNGISIERVDQTATTIFHVLSAIIAAVTIGDIVYKKYKAYKAAKNTPGNE